MYYSVLQTSNNESSYFAGSLIYKEIKVLPFKPTNTDTLTQRHTPQETQKEYSTHPFMRTTKQIVRLTKTDKHTDTDPQILTQNLIHPHTTMGTHSHNKRI